MNGIEWDAYLEGDVILSECKAVIVSMKYLFELVFLHFLYWMIYGEVFFDLQNTTAIAASYLSFAKHFMLNCTLIEHPKL